MLNYDTQTIQVLQLPPLVFSTTHSLRIYHSAIRPHLVLFTVHGFHIRTAQSGTENQV